MKYECGMYGGSFNPLHLGHLECIIKASGLCKRLIVVISNGVNRNEVDVNIRYRWIYQLTKHIGNVEIFILEDNAESKNAYGVELWKSDSDKVKAYAGEKIDAVFCGSDYGKDSFWAKCYPEAELVIFERNEISSTKIRGNVYQNWNMLPDCVKTYYTKKVLIIGCESTGKSVLTKNLANFFCTKCLEEVGRDLSELSGTDEKMLSEDFTRILLTHKLKEMELMENCNKVLFEDTDCLITKFFIDFLKDRESVKNSNLAKAIADINSYDLVLFLEPDVAFVQDGGRSEIIAKERQKFSQKIKQLYIDCGFSFVEISGDYNTRFDKAVKEVKKLFE